MTRTNQHTAKAHEPDDLITAKEACEILKCGLTRLYAFMNAGQLRSVKMGRSRRIPRSAINEFIDHLAKG